MFFRVGLGMGPSESAVSAERKRVSAGRFYASSLPVNLAAAMMMSSRSLTRSVSVSMHKSAFVLAVTPLEIAHKVHQCLYAFERHGVVDAGAHTADGFVAFEQAQTLQFGFEDEAAIEFG